MFVTAAVMDRMKPVSLASFRDHVASRHEDRDKGFETEYQVSASVCVCVKEVWLFTDSLSFSRLVQNPSMSMTLPSNQSTVQRTDLQTSFHVRIEYQL